MLTFVITNNRHHWDLVRPVMQRLGGKYGLRLLSFCEFRGMPTPRSEAVALGAEVHAVPPLRIRPGPSNADGLWRLVSRSGPRNQLYKLVWHLLLRPWLPRMSEGLFIVLNDAAFPGSTLCAELRARGQPFVLIQEGVRFPLPGESPMAYGLGGAGRICCWGQASAEHFVAAGADPGAVTVTGSPRFDNILTTDWQRLAANEKSMGNLPQNYVLFATNPIDDQGFCSTSEKRAAFQDFIKRALPALRERRLNLVIRPHGREAASLYAVDAEHRDGVITIAPDDIPLHTLIAGSTGVLVWASTVGLEALLHEKPLAILAVPGAGYVFDYVSSGAAVGISLDHSVHAKMSSWLDSDTSNAVGREYLDRNIAWRGRATEKVSEAIESLYPAEYIHSKSSINAAQ